jgi:hypothetical protein
MTEISPASRADSSPLEAEIQLAWDRANTALLNSQPDEDEVTGLAASLRHCAARAKAIGFLTGERELLRMACYLEARISQADYPRYNDPQRPAN